MFYSVMDTPTPTINDNVISISNAQERKQYQALNGILQEIKNSLDHLLHSGNETVIELSTIPYGLESEEILLKTLGKGEVTASLTILGSDVIHETGIHGVWWVQHNDEKGNAITKSIYISYIPSILLAQPEDVEYSISLLEKRLMNTQNIEN